MVADSLLTRNPPRPARNFKSENAGERRPFKPKPWSHQHGLKNLIGKKVQVIFRGGIAEEGLSGVLRNADQFALELEISNGEHQSVLTVFKHDLRFYRAV